MRNSYGQPSGDGHIGKSRLDRHIGLFQTLELLVNFRVFRQPSRQVRELWIAQVISALAARLHRFPKPLPAC